MFSRPLVQFVLIAALRDKLVITFLAMIGVGAALAVFLGSASVTEQESFALVFGAAGLRFLGVLGIILFCCFYMRRCFETKEVEFLLSRPISRMNFLFSHAAAFSVFATAVALAVVLAVSLIARPPFEGLAVWTESLVVEYVIMAATALFFSLTLSSAAGSALAVMGFYILARLIGMLLGIAALPPESMIFNILNKTMEVISIIVPRLDLMGQTSWLLYGANGAAGIDFDLHARLSYGHFLVETLTLPGFIAVQGVVFFTLVMAASAFDFSRRQF